MYLLYYYYTAAHILLYPENKVVSATTRPDVRPPGTSADDEDGTQS